MKMENLYSIDFNIEDDKISKIIIIDTNNLINEFNSIEESINYFRKINGEKIIYMLDMPFYGCFIMSYLLQNKSRYKFEYLINDKMSWYYIKLIFRDCSIEFRDIKNITHSDENSMRKSFGGNSKIETINNAVRFIVSKGITSRTIGSACMKDFRTFFHPCDFQSFFPDLTEFTLDKEEYGSENAYEYVRNSYKGAWCYLKRGCSSKTYHNGIDLDVNSLYPSEMSGKSENVFPICKPKFFKNEIPSMAFRKNIFYFVRVKTKFRIKKGYLPFITLEDTRYPIHKQLESSDYFYNNRFHNDFTPTITLTQTEWDMFQEYYDLYDTEILDGCMFRAIDAKDLFDGYIDKYFSMKKTSKGAEREIAKMFLNNLYGKFGTDKKFEIKEAKIDKNGMIYFTNKKDTEVKKTRSGYIPIASAIISYSRRFTINSAQENYDNFIYSDTDCIHCNCSLDEIKGCEINDSELLTWKIETEWDEAYFKGQKRYIEKRTDGTYKIILAGLDKESCNKESENFNNGIKEIKDFAKGFKIKDCKRTVRIPYGAKKESFEYKVF